MTLTTERENGLEAAPIQMEGQQKPKKQRKKLKKRREVAGNSTPPPDSEDPEPKLVTAAEEHWEDDPYNENSDTDFRIMLQKETL